MATYCCIKCHLQYIGGGGCGGGAEGKRGRSRLGRSIGDAPSQMFLVPSSGSRNCCGSSAALRSSMSIVKPCTSASRSNCGRRVIFFSAEQTGCVQVTTRSKLNSRCWGEKKLLGTIVECPRCKAYRRVYDTHFTIRFEPFARASPYLLTDRNTSGDRFDAAHVAHRSIGGPSIAD